MKFSNYVATFSRLVATFLRIVKTNDQDIRETLGTVAQTGFDQRRDCLKLGDSFTNNIHRINYEIFRAKSP